MRICYMDHEIITSYQQFRELRNEWNSLLSRSRANTVFLTWEWLDAWWQAYRTTERPYIILLWRNQDELVGIAPFVLNTIKKDYFFSYKALYFWGLKFDDSESEYLDIIAAKGIEKEVCCQLIEVLNRNRKEWDIFFYYEVPENSLCLDVIKESIKSQKWLFNKTSHIASFIKLPKTFDEYLKGLKPRMRTKLKTLSRRLRENHAVEFEVCSKEKLSVTLLSLFELHQKRWEKVNQLGCFRDPRRREFYKLLSNYFFDNNWLRIFSLKVDGVYRTHEFCFLYNNKIFILQEGYDVEWQKQGVGNVLRTFSLQYCIENKYDEYDILGGTSYHKNSWGVSNKNCVLLAMGRRNIKVRIFFYMQTIIERIRSFYRAIVPNAIYQWRIELFNAHEAKKIRNILSCDGSFPKNAEKSKLPNDSKSGFEKLNKSKKESKMANLPMDADIRGTIKFDQASRIDGNIERERVTDYGRDRCKQDG
jgi:CelD/BcsL family acetyltransferase involved in cellulose biosynthesis